MICYLFFGYKSLWSIALSVPSSLLLNNFGFFSIPTESIDLNFINNGNGQKLLFQVEEVKKMLNGLITKLNASANC